MHDVSSKCGHLRQHNPHTQLRPQIKTLYWKSKHLDHYNYFGRSLLKMPLGQEQNVDNYQLLLVTHSYRLCLHNWCHIFIHVVITYYSYKVCKWCIAMCNHTGKLCRNILYSVYTVTMWCYKLRCGGLITCLHCNNVVL